MSEWADKNSIKSVLTKGGTKRSLLELYQIFVHVAWQHDLGGPQRILKLSLIKTLLLLLSISGFFLDSVTSTV